MTGYSETPLAEKLGLVANVRLLVVNEPPEFQAALGPLPAGVARTSSFGGTTQFDVAVLFVRTNRSLERGFARVAARMTPAGGLWIAWPKHTSGIETDVTENTLRKVVLPTGFVDNKVCAIDERWSGLRFVLRKDLRPGATVKKPSGTARAQAGSKTRTPKPPRRKL
ncbi:MAG: DUF3052 domain-containing protein [Planctomycetota bacterium]|nr:DUF3052 domain-containing protein [Planctomycetota bacterium]